MIESEEAIVGTSDLQPNQTEVVGYLRTYGMLLAFEVGGSLVG